MNLEIENSLRNDRKLRQSSIKTYKSTFNKVAREFGIKLLGAAWLKQNADKVLDWVITHKHGSRVAIYSSLLVLLSPSRKKDPHWVPHHTFLTSCFSSSTNTAKTWGQTAAR